MRTFNFRYDKITLVGDTHAWDGNFRAIRALSENTDVVFLGDHGLGFGTVPDSITNTMKHLDHCNDLCVRKNVVIYWLRGNHDATYDHIWNSQWSNIHLIKDHAEGVFPNGKKVLFVSGGISVDRYVRKANFDYWTAEETVPFDVEGKYDIFIAHDAPEEFNHSTSSLGDKFGWYVERDVSLMAVCYKQRALISKLAKDSGAKHLYSGHFHNKKVEDIGLRKYTCVDCEELLVLDSETLD